MKSEEKDNKPDPEKAKAELRKIQLEITSLEKQNSWRGHIPLFATLFTIMATALGLWQGVEKFRSDNQKDREIRERELTQKNENQYRFDLQQLLTFPSDEKQTVPLIRFHCINLRNLIEEAYTGEERVTRRHDVGDLISSVTKQDDFDLSKPRNVDFDMAILETCDYYKDTLGRNPKWNSSVISRYIFALGALHDENPQFYEAIIVEQDGSYHAPGKPIDALKMMQFANLAQGFQKHVEVLNASLMDKDTTDEWQNIFYRFFCEFYGKTKNPSFTKRIYKLDDATLQNKWMKCSDVFGYTT